MEGLSSFNELPLYTLGTMASSIPPSSGSDSTPSSSEPDFSSKHKGTFKAPSMTFLGMYFNSEEATKLWTILIQNISHEIDRDTQKSVEAIRKMRGPG